MNVGDKVQFRPYLYDCKKMVTGRIVFLPKHERYARVRFTAVNFFGETVEHFENVQIVDGQLRDEGPEKRGQDK